MFYLKYIKLMFYFSVFYDFNILILKKSKKIILIYFWINNILKKQIALQFQIKYRGEIKKKE
jgi:hypothetical protein